MHYCTTTIYSRLESICITTVYTTVLLLYTIGWTPSVLAIDKGVQLEHVTFTDFKTVMEHQIKQQSVHIILKAKKNY